VSYVAEKLRAAGYQVGCSGSRSRSSRRPATRLRPDLPEPAHLHGRHRLRDRDLLGRRRRHRRARADQRHRHPADRDPSSTSGCEATDFPAAPSGPAVALIQRGTCTFQQKAENAAAAGYEAVIIFNEGQAGRQELFIGTLGAPQSIPVIFVPFALGQDLVQQATARNVTVRVATDVISETRTTRNVLADTPCGRIDRVVVVGAHLDSVIEGPGINDNGSGSSTILEIALQMKRLNIKPLNKVRFAFWGAEELGLLGSDLLRPEPVDPDRRNIDVNLNFDMVGSPNYARFVYDGDGSLTPDDPDDAGPRGRTRRAGLPRLLREPELGDRADRVRRSSDYGPFIAAGIAAGGLFSGPRGSRRPRRRRSSAARPGWRSTPATTRPATRSATSRGRRSTSWATRPPTRWCASRSGSTR
jgi:Zn-dependent M28 family amino/carboxypeptidase